MRCIVCLKEGGTYNFYGKANTHIQNAFLHLVPSIAVSKADKICSKCNQALDRLAKCEQQIENIAVPIRQCHTVANTTPTLKRKLTPTASPAVEAPSEKTQTIANEGGSPYIASPPCVQRKSKFSPLVTVSLFHNEVFRFVDSFRLWKRSLFYIHLCLSFYIQTVAVDSFGHFITREIFVEN